MAEPTITCPDCGTEIRLTESLAAPLLAATRKDYEARIASERSKLELREAALETEREAVARARREMDAQVAGKVAALRISVAAEEAEKARAAVSGEVDAKTRQVEEMSGLLAEREEKLKAAQAAQAEVLKKSRVLDDRLRELDLTVETRIAESLNAVREKARAEAEGALKLKVAERDEQLAAMGRQVAALKQRLEQGSQQLQGEVLELDFETAVRAKFPGDTVEPVAKGVSGADMLQRVTAPGGAVCGAILWETKRTKAWGGDWLAKLRADQRAAGAEISLMVSQALPKEVETFAPVDGVWVTDYAHALPLAVALRESLIALGNAKAARDGQGTKMELVYEYLTGPRFRHRIEAIVEKFTDMSADLDRERKAMTRLWAKREAQIDGVIAATVGMYGDLQGIAGQALEEIEGLELPLLDGPDED